jgi:hypothetical protein
MLIYEILYNDEITDKKVKPKKVCWCWIEGKHILNVEGTGIDIHDAYQNLSDHNKKRAIKNVAWIEVNGIKQ